jgi:hypothetical protein
VNSLEQRQQTLTNTFATRILVLDAALGSSAISALALAEDRESEAAD